MSDLVGNLNGLFSHAKDHTLPSVLVVLSLVSASVPAVVAPSVVAAVLTAAFPVLVVAFWPAEKKSHDHILMIPC